MTFENKYARFMRNTGPARILLPFGLILIVVGIILFGFRSDNYLETTGKITSVTEAASDQEDQTQYDLELTFSVDGKEYKTEFTGMSGSYSTGDDIKVYYDPKDPEKNTPSKMGSAVPIAFIGVGAAALLFSIYKTVDAFKKSKELDSMAPPADAQAQAELDSIKTTPGVTEYYFRLDGKPTKPGFVIEDAARNVLYEGKMLKNSLVGARSYEFTDHRTGYTQQHEVGHVMTTSYNDEFFSVKSWFKFDGEKIWDLLHKQGFRMSTSLYSKFPNLTYEVTKNGSAFARIESCSKYVHEEEEAQHKLTIPVGSMYYRFWTASDDLESLFMIMFALSECEQTVVE